MLTMTTKAAQAIRSLAAWEPEWDGVRLSRDPSGRLMVCAARGPVEGDRMLEESGARLYLERRLVPIMVHKTLDAGIRPDGGVTFNLED